MSKYFGEDNTDDVMLRAMYDEKAKELGEEVLEAYNRIKRRANHYREIDFDTAIKEAEEEINALAIPEDKKKELLSSELRDVRDQFFIFNNCTAEQILKYLELCHEVLLKNSLKIAMEEAMKETKDRLNRKSHLLDKKGNSTETMVKVENDAEEIANMGRIGVIERVQVLEKRQENKRFRIIKGIKEVYDKIPSTVGYGIHILAAVLSAALNAMAKQPLGASILGYLFIEAAIFTILGIRSIRDIRKFDASLEEAKESGLYKKLIEFDVAKNNYFDYFRKMGEEYDFEEFERGNRISGL